MHGTVLTITAGPSVSCGSEGASQTKHLPHRLSHLVMTNLGVCCVAEYGLASCHHLQRRSMLQANSQGGSKPVAD